jgi:hypothetical protein
MLYKIRVISRILKFNSNIVIVIVIMYVQLLSNKLTYKLHNSKPFVLLEDGQELRKIYVGAIINKNTVQ